MSERERSAKSKCKKGRKAEQQREYINDRKCSAKYQ
jgi:hypothetical protein